MKSIRFEDFISSRGANPTQYDIGYGNGLRDAQTGAIGCHDSSHIPRTPAEYSQGWRDGYDDETIGIPDGKDG